MVASPHDLPPLFSLGRVVATPGALKALKDTGIDGKALLGRHQRGDYGDLSEHDRLANADAMKDGGRILSAYSLPNGVRIWIITEAAGDDGKRACTTFLMPDDY